MCKIAVRVWFKLFNLAEALLGLATLGYGVYLVIKTPSVFADLVSASGGFMFLVALLGYFSVGGTRSLCLKLYSVLLFVLMAVHAVLAIFCLAEKQKVIDWVQEHADNSEQSKDLEDFISQHIQNIGYIAVVVAAVELLSFLLTCCARDSITAIDDDWETKSYSNAATRQNQPLLLAGSEPSKHPKTDAQREALNRKYGGIFKKTTSTSSEDVEI